MAERVAAGARAGPAQNAAFESRDGGAVRPGGGLQPQQRMLEQRQERHRLEAAERCFGGEPREHAGRRIGKCIAARIVDRDMPAFECGDDAAR